MNNYDNNNNNCNPTDNKIESFADWLLTLSPFEFTSLAVITGYIISCNLTVSQQNSIGNWFELLGQIILTFNAQGSEQQTSPTCQDIEDLKRQIEDLKRKNNLN